MRGNPGNFGLINYRKTDSLLFTYINFEIIKTFWPRSIEDIESVFILDFVKEFGVYPVCNNKTGFPELSSELAGIVKIHWGYFN